MYLATCTVAYMYGTTGRVYRVLRYVKIRPTSKRKGFDIVIAIAIAAAQHSQARLRHSHHNQKDLLDMGNCCPKGGADASSNFQGEGRRLGTADEAAFGSGGAPGAMPIKRDEDLPKPKYDKNLDDDERTKIRADRAAAAEARAKKAGGGGTKKKKASTENKPLVGPNSQPTMRWTS